jgi:hypothetical protein
MLRRLPASVALRMLGALSLRLGQTFPEVVTLVLLVLLFIPRAVLRTTLAAELWGGALTWAGMAWLRVSERLTMGLPWIRLAIIFGAVTAFTAWAAWLLRRPKAEGPPLEKAGCRYD